MVRIFKCDNCKRMREVEEESREGSIVMILCGCGYYMDEIKKRGILDE